LFFGSADIYTILGGYRANWYSVRCLKN
jgi:hypothetical protein